MDVGASRPRHAPEPLALARCTPAERDRVYALVVMTFPTIWASVLLDRLPTELGSLAAACTRLGVDATPMREGWLALPGGFLAMLSPAPYPEDLLVHPGALEVPARAHTAVLHLSGGGDEAERMMLESITQEVREGRVPSKTTRFQKVERLVEHVRALAPLGPGVVLPLASHRYVPAEAWPATEGAGETFGLFVTIGRAGDVLQTRGMSVFAVSECACATLHPAETAPRLFDVAFEVAWRGHTPREGGVFEAFVDREVPPCELTPVLPDLLWIGDPHDPAGAIALHDAAVRAQARTVFAAPALFDDPGASGDVASITMHGALEGPRRAMTVGLARLPRAEGPVELITTSPALSAHAGFALGQVAALLAANPDALGPYHRVAIETLAPAGLAGVVIWPSGHLQLGGRVIALWELLPITPEELAAFRAGGQEAWMDHVEDTNGFEALQARWCGAR